MNVWTVMQTDEDGITTSWLYSYASEQAAHKAIFDYHAELWAEMEMPEEGGQVIGLPTDNFHTVICLVDHETSWTTWTVTKTELEN